MKTKKGAIQVGESIGLMIGIFILLVLAFTWFFPTLNGTTAINNSSTLWLGGTNYTWAVPLIAVVVILALVVVVLKKAHLM